MASFPRSRSFSPEKLTHAKRRRLRRDAVKRHHAEQAEALILTKSSAHGPVIPRHVFLQQRIYASDIIVCTNCELWPCRPPLRQLSDIRDVTNEQWQYLPPSINDVEEMSNSCHVPWRRAFCMVDQETVVSTASAALEE